jgi:hypothetical protein
MEHFEVKDLGAMKRYLGMDVTITDDITSSSIKLSQSYDRPYQSSPTSVTPLIGLPPPHPPGQL